jgi:hypothetical protein
MNNQFCVTVHQKLPSNSIKIHCYEKKQNFTYLHRVAFPMSLGAKSEAPGSEKVYKNLCT